MKKWLATVLIASALPLSGRATTMLPMYMDDLTAASQTVVVGKVIASRTAWDEGHHMIYTTYTVAPSQYLKGQLGATFELREPGGAVDGMEMIIADAPAFQTGQDALLFVWTDPHGNHQVAAFSQGAVSIQTDAATGAQRASRAIPLGSARENGGLSIASASPGPPLPQLLDQIRASITKTSGQARKE